MAGNVPKQRKRSTGESFAERLERAVSTVANAASVAVTGSELGVLELAVEDDLGMRKPKKKPVRKSAKKKSAKKTARKPAAKGREIAAKRPRKPAKKKRAVKRRSR